MGSVELRGVTKRYGDVSVVNDVSLTVEHGHLVCLLGPSGCGKTTTLRLVAGFVEPSGGEIHVGGKLMSSPAHSVPPERRNMSMIFQSYALWPHMTVAENIVYGLRLRKVDRAAVEHALERTTEPGARGMAITTSSTQGRWGEWPTKLSQPSMARSFSSLSEPMTSKWPHCLHSQMGKASPQ